MIGPTVGWRGGDPLGGVRFLTEEPHSRDRNLGAGASIDAVAGDRTARCAPRLRFREKLSSPSHDERQERFPRMPEWFQSLLANREAGIIGFVDIPAWAGRLGNHFPAFALAKLVDCLDHALVEVLPMRRVDVVVPRNNAAPLHLGQRGG
jgi:hypothetical protein